MNETEDIPRHWYDVRVETDERWVKVQAQTPEQAVRQYFDRFLKRDKENPMLGVADHGKFSIEVQDEGKFCLVQKLHIVRKWGLE